MIRRHSTSAIFMHWFNAIFWIGLLFSGFALLANPSMQPVGMWWVELWNGLIGAEGLLQLHLVAGFIWIGVYIGYILFAGRREVWPFLQEIFRLSPASDLRWCLRKGLWLVLGEKGAARLGLDLSLPPQGFYNAGQKIAAVIAVLTGVGLAGSGLVLAALALNGVSSENIRYFSELALFTHFACAGLMAVVLPVHIYMAALAPGEGPALRSMFTGLVPEGHAAEHNPLWVKTLADTIGVEQDHELPDTHR